MYNKDDYWKNYMEKWFGQELIQKWERFVTVEKIFSNNNEINLEVYDSGKKDAIKKYVLINELHTFRHRKSIMSNGQMKLMNLSSI